MSFETVAKDKHKADDPGLDTALWSIGNQKQLWDSVWNVRVWLGCILYDAAESFSDDEESLADELDSVVGSRPVQGAPT